MAQLGRLRCTYTERVDEGCRVWYLGSREIWVDVVPGADGFVAVNYNGVEQALPGVNEHGALRRVRHLLGCLDKTSVEVIRADNGNGWVIDPNETWALRLYQTANNAPWRVNRGWTTTVFEKEVGWMTALTRTIEMAEAWAVQERYYQALYTETAVAAA